MAIKIIDLQYFTMQKRIFPFSIPPNHPCSSDFPLNKPSILKKDPIFPGFCKSLPGRSSRGGRAGPTSTRLLSKSALAPRGAPAGWDQTWEILGKILGTSRKILGDQLTILCEPTWGYFTI